MEEPENKYQLLFKNSYDLFFFTDSEGKISEVNSAGAKLLGYDSPSEIIGRSIRDFYYDKTQQNHFFETLKKDGRVHNLELILVKKNGNKLFCLEDAYLLKNHGENKIEYHGIIKDITPRVESEKLFWRKNIELSAAIRSLKTHQNRLRYVLTLGNCAWWEIEVETGRIEFSSLKAELLGFENQDFNYYQDFIELIHPDDKRRVTNLVEALFENTINSYETTYRIKDSQNVYQRWYEAAEILEKKEALQRPQKLVGISIESRNIEERLKDVD
ncbi:MAG: PAS domain-containing protein [Spirochaetaceae bacterium]